MAMFLVYQDKKAKIGEVLSGIRSGRAIAFISDRFPLYTETLAYREYLYLERAGVHMVALSIYKENPGPLPNEAIAVLEKTRFVKNENLFKKAVALLIVSVTHPLRMLHAGGCLVLAGMINPFSIFRLAGDLLHGCVVARWAKKQGIEHVHVHHIGRAAAAMFVAHHLSGIPYSVTVYPADLNRVSSYGYLILKRAEWIVCMSQRQKKRLLAVAPDLPEDRIKILRPGVDVDLFKPRPKEPGLLHQYRLLTITRLSRDRGLDILVEACRILDARGLDYEAIIIGDGPLKEKLQAAANEMRLNHRIRFAGARRMEEIMESMAKADLFVLPKSGDEDGDVVGINMAMIEAMAMGIPVVTTETEGIRELVDESNGRLIESIDPVVLADVIEELLTQSFIRTELGAAARRRVERRFNLQKNVRNLMILFGVLCGEPEWNGSENGNGANGQGLNS